MAAEKTDLSISPQEANTKALPIVLFLFAAMFPLYWLFWGKPGGGGFFEFQSLIPAFLGGICLHELLHGITWKIAGKTTWENISFGVHWKYLTPYAHCKVPVRKDAYVLALLMPLFLLGILPYLVSLLTGSAWLLWFGIIFTLAAAGDILVYRLIRQLPGETLLEDHPERVGCLILENENTHHGV